MMCSPSEGSKYHMQSRDPVRPRQIEILGLCGQRRPRPDYAPAQSDQGLTVRYRIIGYYRIYDWRVFTDRSKAVVPVLVLLFVALWFRSARRFVLSCLVLFILVFFSPFSIAITSLGEERANLSTFRTFVRFALVWLCRFPLPHGVWEGLRLVIVALPRLFSYFFFVGGGGGGWL